MTSEPTRREVSAAQVLAVGAGAGVAGVLFLVTGYPGTGIVMVIVGAVIAWLGWWLRSGRLRG